MPLLGWQAGPHLSQCGLGPGLYLCSKWHLDSSSRLATMGRQVGAAVPLFRRGSWVPYPTNTMSPIWAEAYVPSVILIHPAVWPQQTWAENRGAVQKIAKNWPSAHHRTNLSGYIFANKARIDNRKKPVKQQYVFHMSS